MELTKPVWDHLPISGVHRTFATSLEPRVDTTTVEVAQAWQTCNGAVGDKVLHTDRALFAHDWRVLRQLVDEVPSTLHAPASTVFEAVAYVSLLLLGTAEGRERGGADRTLGQLAGPTRDIARGCQRGSKRAVFQLRLQDRASGNLVGTTRSRGSHHGISPPHILQLRW